jgi:5-methylcytosine-specific restriction endonuclease McrA
MPFEARFCMDCGTRIPPRLKREPIPPKLRFEVLKRDNFTCAYCGRKPPEGEIHIDHVTPVSAGGTNQITNLVAACADCNRGKGPTALSDDSWWSLEE